MNREAYIGGRVNHPLLQLYIRWAAIAM